MNIQIEGVLLHYEIYGEGKPIIILHGWGGSIHAVAPIWQFLRSKYCVYVIDFPGMKNESSDPPTPWGVPEYAKLVKTFMESMNLKKPDVIAHSFGGRIAIFLAAQDENLFGKIVLVDAAGIKPKGSWKTWVRKMAFRGSKAMMKLVLPKEKYQQRLMKLRQKYASLDYAMLDTNTMRKTFQNVISLDLTCYLEKVQNPTALIWGECDQDTPLYMAKKMEQKIPSAKLSVLSGAGHFSYLDSPTQFQIILDRFLSNE